MTRFTAARRAAVASAPWKVTASVVALWRDALTAQVVLNGPLTGEAFLAYVQQIFSAEGVLARDSRGRPERYSNGLADWLSGRVWGDSTAVFEAFAEICHVDPDHSSAA